MEKSKVIRIIAGIFLLSIFCFFAYGVIDLCSTPIKEWTKPLYITAALLVGMLLGSVFSLIFAILLFRGNISSKKIRLLLGIFFIIIFSIEFFVMDVIGEIQKLFTEGANLWSNFEWYIIHPLLTLVIIALLFRRNVPWLVMSFSIAAWLIIFLLQAGWPFAPTSEAFFFLFPIFCITWASLPLRLYKKNFIFETNNFLKIIVPVYWIHGLIIFFNSLLHSYHDFGYIFEYFIWPPFILLSFLSLFLLIRKSRKALEEKESLSQETSGS